MNKRLHASFYRTPAGNEPVREWLKEMSKEDRGRIGADILTVEAGWPIGMPTCRPLGAGIQEIRTNLAGGRISRVLFFIEAGHLYLLHGFIKKTLKTPQQDLELAMSRKNEITKFLASKKHEPSGGLL